MEVSRRDALPDLVAQDPDVRRVRLRLCPDKRRRRVVDNDDQLRGVGGDDGEGVAAVLVAVDRDAPEPPRRQRDALGDAVDPDPLKGREGREVQRAAAVCDAAPDLDDAVGVPERGLVAANVHPLDNNRRDGVGEGVAVLEAPRPPDNDRVDVGRSGGCSAARWRRRRG